MEPITEPGIDLFADDLPSMEEIKKLSEVVHSSESDQISFSEQLEANMSRTSPRAVLAVGIGLYIVSRDADAVRKLEKAKDRKEKFIYLAFAFGEWADSMRQSRACKRASIMRPTR